ncbi:MAG: nitrogenase iron-molybdenum cofactor biosynthesis protein NifE [Thermodesulfovibrionales bacterium]
MVTNLDRLTEHGCSEQKTDKVCRSRGGESCAFDGAMIVLQPIADAAHLVHGPIACCGNSWEGRGSRSSRGVLDRMGFTTDMSEMDIVYGSEEKLAQAVRETAVRTGAKAVFVHATCVSGLIGEDIEAACRKSSQELGMPVIPVNAPGFIGPKNLGNRIAGEVLLEHVIGTAEPPTFSPPPAKGELGGIDINLIGEYNIAGDLWEVEPLLRKAGFSVLSRITGDASFQEISWAHRAKLNVVVCSWALINVAHAMEEKYGIPFVEVSFFGRTEIAKALRIIGSRIRGSEDATEQLCEKIEKVIAEEERELVERLRPFEHLRGRKAVLYTGGVKSWSFISCLMDLGIEVVAVGTKKSTFEDEEKMKQILGPDAPLVEDVTPGSLKKLLRERTADILVAGGRNQYLAIKEGYPFVDVNQERHTAYAGYNGFVNFARDISNSVRFYQRQGSRDQGFKGTGKKARRKDPADPVVVNPLKHSQSIGAAIALQGVHNCLPVIHGTQGCTFLGKVLLTKHFREPIALAGTKLFAEDVVMGSEERLASALRGFIEKNRPDLLAVITSGLTEVKGDDAESVVREISREAGATGLVLVRTPDYEGGLETGYCRAIEMLAGLADTDPGLRKQAAEDRVTILAGPHLTPADFFALREIVEAFGLRPLMLPDLSCLDGSREGFSPLASGGTTVAEISDLAASSFTLAIGRSLEPAARLIRERFGTGYRVFEGISGLRDTDLFLETLATVSGRPLPERFGRQRRSLVDSMRDCHAVLGGREIVIALEPDHALQTSRWLSEAGAVTRRAIVPQAGLANNGIEAKEVVVSDLSMIEGRCSLIVANSHAADTAERLGVPLLQAGFPVYKTFGYTNRVTIGYGGTRSLIQEAATAVSKEVHS